MTCGCYSPAKSVGWQVGVQGDLAIPTGEREGPSGFIVGTDLVHRSRSRWPS